MDYVYFIVDVVIAYCNVVTYIVQNTYIVIACNGNTFSADSYLFKVNNRNLSPRCEIRSKLTIKTAEQGQ